MSESTFAKDVMKKLQKYPGCFPVRIQPGPYGSSGKTDILLCFWGYFIAIELKYGKGKPTPLQEKFMKDVRNKGHGRTLVAWEWDKIRDFLEDFKKEINI